MAPMLLFEDIEYMKGLEFIFLGVALIGGKSLMSTIIFN